MLRSILRLPLTGGSLLLAVLAAAATAPALAGSFDAFGLDAEYQLQATYAVAIRTEKPSDGIINAPPSADIPIPDYLKFPESNNFDDGDRNFRRGSLVNNRLTLLGQLQFSRDDYGLLLRGDAFYDRVYRSFSDNDSPATISRTEGDVNQPFEGDIEAFSDEAAYFDGRRARLLDAYVYGSWYVGDEGAINLRVGRHIAAWGESLFFSGVALAQAPADATKAAIPGADVKSILLPVNQVSMQYALNSQWTLLGQYKLEYKETELNPVGEYLSVADVVGPGAQFIYGIRNPLYFANLADVNLLSSDLPQTISLLNDLLELNLPIEQQNALLNQVLTQLAPVLPDASVPIGQIPQPGTPRYINVRRDRDIRPSDHGQYGVGVKYQVTPETNLGLYRLRYHNTTPAPVQNYGYAVLLPGMGAAPPVTTESFGLQVPVTYNIRYFDGVDLSAMSVSTTLFGVNVGGELLWREGVDVLVDVDGGLLGPVPTPTRADVGQVLLSGIYSTGPALFWDAFTLVGETGYIHVADVEQACGPSSCSKDLTNSRDASGYAFLALIDRRNIFDGWDLQIPLVFQGVIDGQSSLLAGLGSLMGEGDMRASAGTNFTWLQKFVVGASYTAFLGEPHFKKRPYADRDFAGFSLKYQF